MSYEVKPRLPISLDVETLDTTSNAAIIEIGAVPLLEGLAPFDQCIDPGSYEDTFLFDVNPETIAWHKSQGQGLIERCTATGISWRQAAVKFLEYLKQFNAQYEIHIWCQGKDFDGPIITNLFKAIDEKAPWSYKHIHCLRDLAQQYPEVRHSSKNNHTALRDAMNQANHLATIAARNERVYKWLWGRE